MKLGGMLGLFFTVTVALMALNGAATASATVLCYTTPSIGHCGATWEVAAGTTIDLSIESSLALKTSGGTTIATCTQGTIKGKTSNTGSTTETVKGPIETFTFASCNTTVDVLANGALEIHHVTGTDNGTVTSNAAKVTINFLGASCIFETKNTDIGLLTGGKPATIDISATIPGVSGGLCPASGIWSGNYRWTEPAGTTVHVAAG